MPSRQVVRQEPLKLPFVGSNPTLATKNNYEIKFMTAKAVIEDWIQKVLYEITSEIPQEVKVRTAGKNERWDYTCFLKVSPQVKAKVLKKLPHPARQPWFVNRIEYTKGFINFYLSHEALNLNMKYIQANRYIDWGVSRRELMQLT